MTEHGGTGAGGRRPQPGYTFADKRKLKQDGSPAAAGGDVTTPTPPVAEGVTEPAADELVTDEPVAAAAAEGTANDEQSAAISEYERLAAERLSDLQRLQAEYANYRKRVDRDRELSREQAIASVVESLLPVLDDIHLARQHGDLESGPFVSIAEKLEATLSKYGVERFGEPGTAFDPAIHDALMHVEEELAEGTDTTTVVGVLQPGYRIGERIIRPARVSVADPK